MTFKTKFTKNATIAIMTITILTTTTTATTIIIIIIIIVVILKPINDLKFCKNNNIVGCNPTKTDIVHFYSSSQICLQYPVSA